MLRLLWPELLQVLLLLVLLVVVIVQSSVYSPTIATQAMPLCVCVCVCVRHRRTDIGTDPASHPFSGVVPLQAEFWKCTKTAPLQR
jgi:hypothetical protein